MTGQTLYRLTLIALTLVAVTGCRDEQKMKVDQNALVRTSLDNLIAVKGGEFQMGDFGRLVAEKLPYNFDQDTPLHPVMLSDFRIGKYRVTWGEFNRWLVIQKREKTAFYQSRMNNTDPDFQSSKIKFGDTYPASVSWQDARDYCQWLGHVSHRNMDLPTEAQWEYAARSRGQFLIYGNSTNRWYYENDPSLNFTLYHAPVGSFPPNPFGLYDMMGNGADWVKDWYAADYYSHSPEKDPQGPESGEKKVRRGLIAGSDSYTITRSKLKLDSEFGSEFRCVENSPLR